MNYFKSTSLTRGRVDRARLSGDYSAGPLRCLRRYMHCDGFGALITATARGHPYGPQEACSPHLSKAGVHSKYHSLTMSISTPMKNILLQVNHILHNARTPHKTSAFVISVFSCPLNRIPFLDAKPCEKAHTLLSLLSIGRSIQPWVI